ncbi:NUDIX domain-containing protein [Nonomuraea sp. bgisy101]|uniref:NUDIX domain-containing protein n=1 Tax=Nonomuraea sp. bgisy101 TaxID=3413784 RepID=UPI003D739300
MGFDGFLVPDWAKPYVGWVVGTEWPEGDESGCFRLADACAATAKNVMAGEGLTQAARPGEDWDGEALEAFLTFVRQVWGDRRVELVERLVAAALEFNRVGVQVEYTKRMIEVAVWFLIFQIGWLLAAAVGPWGGVSLAMIGPRLQLTRLAIAQLGKRLLINVGFFGVLLGGMDLAVQASQSRRDNIDWQQVLTSAGSGALTGAFLTAFTGFFPTRSMWGLMTRSGLAGGATAATMELFSGRPLDEKTLRTVLMNVTAGFLGGADAHWASWNPSTGSIAGTGPGLKTGGDLSPTSHDGPHPPSSGSGNSGLPPSWLQSSTPGAVGGPHPTMGAQASGVAQHGTPGGYDFHYTYAESPVHGTLDLSTSLSQATYVTKGPADSTLGPTPHHVDIDAATSASQHHGGVVKPEPGKPGPVFHALGQSDTTTGPKPKPSIDSLINGAGTPHAPAPASKGPAGGAPPLPTHPGGSGTTSPAGGQHTAPSVAPHPVSSTNVHPSTVSPGAHPSSASPSVVSPVADGHAGAAGPSAASHTDGGATVAGHADSGGDTSVAWHGDSGGPVGGVKDASSSPFKILDDTGRSGDGWAGPGLWGKYGAAGVLIRNTDATGVERYLLVQCGPGVSSNVGKWQLPGGALDSKETPAQGAAREISEELGVNQGYLDTLELTGTHVVEAANGWKYTSIAAEGEIFTPKVDKIETADAKWVTLFELRDMASQGELHPALAKSLNDVLSLFHAAKHGSDPAGPAALSSTDTSPNPTHTGADAGPAGTHPSSADLADGPPAIRDAPPSKGEQYVTVVRWEDRFNRYALVPKLSMLSPQEQATVRAKLQDPSWVRMRAEQHMKGDTNHTPFISVAVSQQRALASTDGWLRGITRETPDIALLRIPASKLFAPDPSNSLSVRETEMVFLGEDLNELKKYVVGWIPNPYKGLP